MESLGIFDWLSPIMHTLLGYNCGVYDGHYDDCVVVAIILAGDGIKTRIDAHAWSDQGTVSVRSRDEKAANECLRNNQGSM
jgi:hypothetical protein